MRFTLPVGRTLLFWIPLFTVMYAASFYLFHFYVATMNPLIGVAMTLFAPFLYLIFGWLYYRRAGLSHWDQRLVVIVIWIALSVGVAALLIKPIYGYDWTAAINWNVLNGQALNAAAMVVAAYVASGKPIKKDETDGLEGPKF